LVKTGKEFLEASWNAASMGGEAPLDPSQLNLTDSAYRSLRQVRESALEAGVPWWTVSPLASGDEHEYVPDLSAAPTARGSEEEISTIFATLRAHVTAGGTAAIVVGGSGTVHRILSRLSEAEVPAVAAGSAEDVRPGTVLV